MTPWAVLAFTILTAGAGPQVVDETFDLDISERVIEQHGYEAAQALRIDQPGLRMDIGVHLAAGTIRVLLRNVKGHVRFRADAGPIASALKGLAGAPAAGSKEGGRP